MLYFRTIKINKLREFEKFGFEKLQFPHFGRLSCGRLP
jgi:hypothetical protein